MFEIHNINITLYCETPRANGVPRKTDIKSRPSSLIQFLYQLRVSQQDVMLSGSVRSSQHRFPYVPPGRSRRQAGVLLQGHPRPWPVAKLRTLRVPARKVQHRWNASELRRIMARLGH